MFKSDLLKLFTTVSCLNSCYIKVLCLGLDSNSNDLITSSTCGDTNYWQYPCTDKKFIKLTVLAWTLISVLIASEIEIVSGDLILNLRNLIG